MNEARFKEILVERLRWRAVHQVGNELLANINVETYAEFVADRVVVTMTAEFMGRRGECHVLESEMVPRSWWQAFKNEVFPGWMKLRFTPHMRLIDTRLEVIRVCPHVDVPKNDARHYRFLDID